MDLQRRDNAQSVACCRLATSPRHSKDAAERLLLQATAYVGVGGSARCYLRYVPFFQRHVFVCINERPADHPKGCCKARGGALVRDALKAELTKRGLSKQIRANNAGCLDQCEHGVTVVVYPEQVWYGGVTVDDVNEIVETHLVGGQPVTRLLIQDKP